MELVASQDFPSSLLQLDASTLHKSQDVHFELLSNHHKSFKASLLRLNTQLFLDYLYILLIYLKSRLNQYHLLIPIPTLKYSFESHQSRI
jgi:hypothetical protein